MGPWHTLAKQFRQPSGFLGNLVGLVLRLNLQGIDWTIGLLDIQPTDHVLEIGFGPGHAIQKVATLASQGRVAGIDFSEAMVRQARKRNAAAIAAGRVELVHGDASVLLSLLYPSNVFDKAFAANIIYFWKDTVANLKELHRVLKPGGRLALYFIAKDHLTKLKLTRTGVYTLYSGEEAVQVLTQTGFRNARFVSKSERLRTGICALAEK